MDWEARSGWDCAVAGPSWVMPAGHTNLWNTWSDRVALLCWYSRETPASNSLQAIIYMKACRGNHRWYCLMAWLHCMRHKASGHPDFPACTSGMPKAGAWKVSVWILQQCPADLMDLVWVLCLALGLRNFLPLVLCSRRTHWRRCALSYT